MADHLARMTIAIGIMHLNFLFHERTRTIPISVLFKAVVNKHVRRESN